MNLQKYLPENQFRYYYSLLKSDKEKIYDTLLCGLLEHKKIIIISNATIEDIFQIFNYIRYDIPELFFVKTITAINAHVFNSIQIKPDYRFSEDDTILFFESLDNKYNDFINNSKNLMSDIEKEKAIHDLIVDNVTYKDVDAPYSHEIPGTLLYGIGVCEGIAKSTKWLCDRIGLKSIVALGSSNANGNSGGHAWNVIFIDSKPFHIDITFDSTVASHMRRYDYLNLSDKEILEDHTINNKYPLPECTFSKNWYKSNNQYFETKQELVRFIRSINTNNIKGFCFQLPKFNINEEDIQKLINVINTLIQVNINLSPFSQKNYFVNCNPNRMVFEVFFQ